MTAYNVVIITPSVSVSAAPMPEEEAIVHAAISGAVAEIAAKVHGWEGDSVAASFYRMPPVSARSQIKARVDNVVPHGHLVTGEVEADD